MSLLGVSGTKKVTLKVKLQGMFSFGNFGIKCSRLLFFFLSQLLFLITSS